MKKTRKGVLGFAYAIDGNPVTVRTFAHPRLLDGHLESFLRTMAIEADLARVAARREGKKAFTGEASAEDVLTLMREIDKAKVQVFETAGDNVNRVRRNEFGGSLRCEVYLPPGAGEGTPRRVAITEDWTAAEE